MPSWVPPPCYPWTWQNLEEPEELRVPYDAVNGLVAGHSLGQAQPVTLCSHLAILIFRKKEKPRIFWKYSHASRSWAFRASLLESDSSFPESHLLQLQSTPRIRDSRIRDPRIRELETSETDGKRPGASTDSEDNIPNLVLWAVRCSCWAASVGVLVGEPALCKGVAG